MKRETRHVTSRFCVDRTPFAILLSLDVPGKRNGFPLVSPPEKREIWSEAGQLESGSRWATSARVFPSNLAKNNVPFRAPLSGSFLWSAVASTGT